MGFFSNLFGRNPAKKYERDKKIAASGNTEKKRKLAGRTSTNPEILFYLADNSDVEIRRQVAKNDSTPVQASKILAADQDEDVRLNLAERLVRLLPELSSDCHGQLYAFTVKCLHALAEDEVFRIRHSLATSLKDHQFAPPEVLKALAMDTERRVSEPILKYCSKLSDADLLEIISHHPAGWVRSVIVSRENLSAELADRIVDDLSAEDGEKFLRESKTRIGESTMQRIVEKSEEFINWQEPVALRPELNFNLARQLSGFAGAAVLKVLTRRTDFDPETRAEIAEMVERRSLFAASPTPHETLEQKVNRYAAAGALNATTLSDALAWQEDGFVKLGLSRISGVHQLIVDKIFASQSPKSITALCWYAGLPMRLAVELQKTLGRIPAQSLIYARAGVDYPLNETDMIWQLEFFGIQVETTESMKNLQNQK